MSKRDDLLESALRLLAESGEAALTLTGVARAAGTSKGLVLYHFGSKDRLLDAVATSLLDETRRGLEHLEADYPDPERRLVTLVETLFEEPPAAERVAVRNVLAFWLEAGRHARRAALVRDFVVKAVMEGAKSGEIARLRHPERAADALLTHWTGALALWASGHAIDFAAEHAFVERSILGPLAPPTTRKRKRAR